MSYMAYDQLPDPTEKFTLFEVLGTGINAKVYRAKELSNDRIVAVKIQPYDKEHQVNIEEEYRILRDYSSFPNLPDFYGVYRMKNENRPDDIWFILEYCDGGTAVEVVNRLLSTNRKMKEEHIAFILREVARAAVELHRNHFLHRDIRGCNILFTKSGEVKLCDFGLTREVDSTLGKRGTCIGSPCWMSPEVVTAQEARDHEVYDCRSDVWALGITAIELADGKPPFFDMHPTRALFQIVRNPPPTLFKPTNWSQNFNDFITECLEKNPENRPMMVEIVEHPFLTELLENEFSMQQEIKQIVGIALDAYPFEKPEEISVDRGYVRKFESNPEKMYTEDLAAIDNPVDEIVLDHVGHRLKRGESYSFLGDILLSLNSNDLQLEYDEAFHAKYKCKSRSENAPHIFSVSDLAYQDMLHHKEPQHVIFSGESYSGKTTNVRLFIKHLCYLGGGNKGATDRVEKSMAALGMLTNAGTPLNNDSTRCSMQYHITFGKTGKMSGAVFIMHLLEKMRVSSTDMNQHNFHIFYYFYDFMQANKKLKEYHLEDGRNYRYFRIPPEPQSTKLNYRRDDAAGNVGRYQEFEDILLELDISKKNIETIRKIISAILNIGDIRFRQNERRTAEVEDAGIVSKVAELLRVDEKKFMWSMVNYCKVKGGIAERKQYTTEEARDARDALAATIYNRLVDWIINKINMNLAFPRAVFGDVNCIVVYDFFGFECFHRNGIEQLMINSWNEQLQYHYNKRIFASEMLEQEADGIPAIALNFYDNKQTLDNLLTKPDGLFYIIDEASRSYQNHELIMEKVTDKKSQFIRVHSKTELSIAHFTGKIIYDTRAFPDVNRDFVPPEMIESLRTSLDESIVLMFTNQLTKSGNLTMAFENIEHKKDGMRRTYVMNTLSVGAISQVNNVRTLSENFRYTCLELLKTLSQGQGIGAHFVRCVRSDLEYKPKNFHPDMVQQQMKALGVIDTIIARQQGYSCRITFHEFLKRYQFLAFDFDETVDITKDNCRLLLIRLKMEGWAIGKSKVFLRYYNDEFLARLYENQVKKIIKVQSMMRALLARRKMKQGGAAATRAPLVKQDSKSPSEAAVTIQKAYRGFKVRQKYGPLLNERTGQIDQTTASFVKAFAKRWRAKSIFQVLLHYRAARFQDLVNLSQQVHLYNQRVVAGLSAVGRGVPLERVNPRENNASLLGPLPLPTKKLPFRLDQIPFYDTSYMCDSVNPLARTAAANTLLRQDDDEPWDAPLQRNPSLTSHLMTYNAYKKEQACQTNWDKMHESDVVYNQSYLRDPNLVKRASGMAAARSDYFSSDYARNMQNNSQQYNNYGNNSYQMNNRNDFVSRGSGSRRNSLKNYAAPPPPPQPMNMRTNRNQNFNNYANRTDFRPPDPVREMEIIGRRTSMDTTNDDPPFNFKAMLRKTNYSRPENNNVEFTMRQSEQSFVPKLKPTGQNRFGGNDTNTNRSSNFTPSQKSSNYNNTSSDASASYVEEEIAPGITVSGYEMEI